jgi:transcription elongation factor Elf1
MSDISFNCPHCNKRLVVDDEGADLKMNCPVCEQALRIPAKSRPEDETVDEVSDEVIRAIAIRAQRLRREAEAGEPILIARDPEEEEELEEPELDLAFVCPACERPLIVAYEGVGLDLQCPECAAALDIPDPLHLPEDFPHQRLAAQVLALQRLEEHTAPFAQFEKTPQEVPLKPRRITRGEAAKTAAVTESGLGVGDDELLEKAQNQEDKKETSSQKAVLRPAVSSRRKAAIKKPAGPVRFQSKGKTDLTRKLGVAPASADSPEARERRERLLRKANRTQTETLLPRKLAAASQDRQDKAAAETEPEPEQEQEQEPETAAEKSPRNPSTDPGTSGKKSTRQNESRRKRKGALPTPRLPVVDSGAERPFVSVGQHLQRPGGSRSRSRNSKVRIAKVLSPFLLAFLVLMIWVASVFLKTPERSKKTELVAPTQTSETDFQPQVLSPIEERTALVTLQGFLDAQSWEQAVPYIRDPERVRPLMEEYYTDHTFDPEPIIDLTLNQSGWRMGHLLATFSGITVDSYQNRVFHMERMTDGTWKLDWETLVGYNPLSWEELQREMPVEPVVLRCSLSPSEYYNFAFSNSDEYACFKIHDRTGQFTGIYAYAERGSELEERLVDVFQTSGLPAVMLEVRYPRNAQQDNQVEAVSLVRRGWIML